MSNSTSTSIQHFNSQSETAVVLSRPGNEQVTASFLHGGVFGPGELIIATESTVDNPNGEASNEIIWTMEEARHFRDMLNQLPL